MTTFIGIDLGTSGCRAIAIDEDQQILGEATVSLPTPALHGSQVEQDPQPWWAAVCDCLSELTQTIDPTEVAAIAVDGTSSTILLTDEKGTPLGPALMYNDGRSIEQAAAINRIAPTDTAAQGASSTLAKLLWLHENGYTENAAHACHQADWIAAKLSGYLPAAHFISDANNALKLGFDAHQMQWPAWLEQLDFPVQLLPEVVTPGTPIGNIDKTIAKQFNLPPNTRIIAGTTDSTASFLATGASKVGEAVTALGSTLVLKVISEQPVFSATHGVYSQPLITDGKMKWLVGGGSNSGGNVLRQYFSLDQLADMTSKLQPDKPTGLNYYPLPSKGERFPINDAELAPRLEPRPESDVVFFQAMLEGIARIEADGYRLLAELDAPYPVAVRSTGGGAKNDAGTAMRKKLLKTEMLPARHTEAAFGSALLATASFNR